MAAKVASVVGGMEYAVAADVKATRAQLSGATAGEKSKISQYQAKIANSESRIRRYAGRDSQVAEVGAAFGV